MKAVQTTDEERGGGSTIQPECNRGLHVSVLIAFRCPSKKSEAEMLDKTVTDNDAQLYELFG
jgi:hypothetical protein